MIGKISFQKRSIRKEKNLMAIKMKIKEDLGIEIRSKDKEPTMIDQKHKEKKEIA